MAIDVDMDLNLHPPIQGTQQVLKTQHNLSFVSVERCKFDCFIYDLWCTHLVIIFIEKKMFTF